MLLHTVTLLFVLWELSRKRIFTGYLGSTPLLTSRFYLLGGRGRWGGGEGRGARIRILFYKPLQTYIGRRIRAKMGVHLDPVKLCNHFLNLHAIFAHIL
jgi:hypothetical protein